MVDLKELRIGNIVISEYDGMVNISIKLLERVVDKIEEIYPIPITEEWLLKFGFESQGEELYWLGENSKFYIEDYGNGEYNIVECGDWIKSFKYVHQLQNLYFALKETELELK